MAIGTHEKTVRMRASRSAAAWRAIQYEERDGFGYDTVRARPLPSQLLCGLLFARMLDQEPVVAKMIGIAPSVIAVRVPTDQVADVLLRVAPHVAQGNFPRHDKKRSTVQTERRVCALRQYERGFGGMRQEEARERLAGGASILCLWFESEASIPAELRAVLSDSVTLPQIDAQALRWLGGIVTGEPCHVPAGHPIEALTPAQVDVAFAYGLSATECARRLAAFAPASDAPKPSDEGQDKPTTLRELRAFGPATAWGIQLAEDLAAYKAGHLPWSEVDRGALLHGAPGVGKTTFARALAATCDVPLIATSVADWYAKDHLGATLQRIRSVFARASKKLPSILFIDEIDGIGDRSNVGDRNRDYWTQVINCTLECMDGIARPEGLVIVGACNNPDRVDAALRRPGRLDRSIRIPLPDADTLEVLYRHYLGADLPDLNLGPIAAISEGRTGAEIEQLVRQARRSARRDKRQLALHDLVNEIRGAAQLMSPETLWRVVVHEAGHAVVAIALNIAPNVTVSVGNTGNGNLGATRFERPSDLLDTRETALNIARQVLAGRAAEQEIVGEVSGGSGGVVGSDLEQATRIVAALEGALGLGHVGWLTFWGDAADTRTHLFQPHIAMVVEKTLAHLYEETRTLVASHKATIIRVAKALEERLHLSHAELVELISCANPGATSTTEAA